MPQISVLMSVYNGEEFLAEAVESILSQTFEDFEFLIINDGSTDNSTEILQNYAKRDQRIVLIEQENQGLISALNTGLELARAPLIARMDADDVSLPERLERQKAYIDDHSDLCVLGSAVTVIDDQGQEMKSIEYPKSGKFLDNYLYNRGCPVAHPAVMMRKDKIQLAGGYRQAYKHAEDYDLWLRVRRIGEIDNLDEPLLKYRHHQSKVSTNHANQQALASVIARHAIQMDPDPTIALEAITEETIGLFESQRNKIKWEMVDVLASTILLAPGIEDLHELKSRLPEQIVKGSEHAAVRVFLKLALMALRNKSYALTIKYLFKAFLTAPAHTVYLCFEKLT